MDWETDRGLVVRMVAAMVLLALLPVAFAYTMQFAFNSVVFPTIAALTETPVGIRVAIPLHWVLVAVVVGFVLQFVVGESVALRSVGAKRVTAAFHPELVGTVQRLASTAGVKPPTVAVADTDVPNAFAIGRTPGDATIVVTEGLLDTLDDEQIEAVLAHELAHVKNRDVAVMSLAYFLPSLTYVVAIGAFTVLKYAFYIVGNLHIDDDDGAQAALVIIAVLLVSSLVTITVSAMFWLGSFLLFRVLSQYRELAADRGAAAITGNPTALATALQALDEEMTSLPDEDLRETDGGLEALYIAPIDTYEFDDKHDLLSSDLFPQTHPSTAQRVEQLEELTAAMEQ